MFSFQTFTDKRYWILLAVFLVLLIGVSLFASDYIIGKPYGISIFLVVSFVSFWGLYHGWEYVGDRRKRRCNE